MPFESESQRRFMWAKHPKIAKKWSHEFPGQHDLPKHKKKKKEHEKESTDLIANLAQEVRTHTYIDKLASDVGISHELVHHLANLVSLPVETFIKKAYEDVDGFLVFLKVASAPKLTMDLIKEAISASIPGGGLGKLELIKSLLAHLGGKIGGGLSTAGRGIAGAVHAALPPALDKKFGEPALQGGLFGRSEPMASSLMGPLSGSTVGRASVLGAMGGTAHALLKNKPSEAPSNAGSETLTPETTPEIPAEPSASPPVSPKGGMSPMTKAKLYGGGAAALGGAGAYALSRRKKKEKEAMDYKELALNSIKHAIIKKANKLYRKEAALILCKHLDKVASLMSLEKQAHVRTLQKEVSSGKDLSMAIKMAYPQLTGEQRGILATQLVNAALSDHKKQANMGMDPMMSSNIPQVQPQSFTGTPAQAMQFMR